MSWHNHTFCLKLSILGSPLDIKNPKEKNRFRFEKLEDPNGVIYQYSLKPVNAGDMNEAWGSFSKLLPQPGPKLTWALADADKLDPSDADNATPKFKALVANIKEQKIDDPAVTYERLVGTVQAQGADNPITFYRVSNVFKNHEHKHLLIAIANFVNGGAPVGVLAADN
jgi:hypothetical protein